MKDSLESLRDEVREKDKEIVRLLNERAGLSIEIGKIKQSKGWDVYDPAQERKVRDGLLELNQGPLSEAALNTIFKEIVSASRSLQEPLTVAYLGPEASFTQMAAQSHFGASSRFLPQSTIPDIFDETERGKVSCGVVPIENSSEGSVRQTLDRLITTPLQIRAEIFLRISHNLLSCHEDFGSIRRVYSHPQALAQCRMWLRKNLPNAALIETVSTATAAERALQDGESGAIGSARAASYYDLKIAATGIEDNPSNTTRFIAIGKGENRPTGKDKTSILFGTPHAPGALYRALETLASEEINMTRIESHPAKTGPWQYLFFVDFEGHMEDEKTVRCLNGLKMHTTFTKVLGSYPRGDSP